MDLHADHKGPSLAPEAVPVRQAQPPAAAYQARPGPVLPRPPARHGYRSVAAQPGAILLLASAILARLPLGMSSLAILLFVRERSGSFALAGLTVGVYGAASALAGPGLGRLVDRVGQRPVLVSCGVIQAGAMVALVVVERAGLAAGFALAAAVLAGASIPPVAGCLRALWPRVLEPQTVAAAYALDATSQEAVWTVGPILVAVIDAAAGPADAVLASAALSVAGTLAFCAVPLVRRHGHSILTAAAVRGTLLSAGVWVLLISALLFGLAVGQLEVALPALARVLHEPSLAGLLLALWSIGSMLGGLLYGTRRWRSTVVSRYCALLLATAVCIAPLSFAASLPLAFAGALLAGVTNAPLLSCQYVLVRRLSTPERRTEAFTLNMAALTAGVAAGDAISGVIDAASGVPAAVATACLFALLSAAVAISHRRSLEVGAPQPVSLRDRQHQRVP